MPQDIQQTSPDTQENSTADNTAKTNSRTGLDNRHLIRQLIVQKLYEFYVHNANKQLGLSSVEREVDITEDLELNRISHKTEKKLKKGFEKVQAEIDEILAKTAEIDALIQKYAKSWPINQINPVDLQILRLGIYEGFISQKVPAKVAIDEAIELGKDFGTEGNVRFISGVLGNIYSELPQKANG